MIVFILYGKALRFATIYELLFCTLINFKKPKQFYHSGIYK